MGFSYSEYVTTFLSVDLSVCPQILKTLNYFPLNFSLAAAVHRHYSVIKIILYHLLDIQLNKLILSVLKHEIPFSLTAFGVPFQIIGVQFVESIKIILFHLMDIHKKKLLFSVSKQKYLPS